MSTAVVDTMTSTMMLRLICAISIHPQARIVDTQMMKTVRGTDRGPITLTRHTMVTTSRLGPSIVRLRKREKLENTLSSERVGVPQYPTTLLLIMMLITTLTICTKELTVNRDPIGPMTMISTLEKPIGQEIKEEGKLTGLKRRKNFDS